MKKVITLQNQHFLKKNYTYNFFRSSIRFNAFFLKNSFFLFKFYKVFKFFFFINFFLQKKLMFNKFSLSLYKQDKFLFLKKKNINNNYNNLYGQNYILLNSNSNSQLLKVSTNYININTNSNIINYNYINLFNYNQFFNLILLNNSFIK
jgi:hypothetical protein